MAKTECPNCFRKTWNGKKCTSCGAISVGIKATDETGPIPNRLGR